MKFLPTFENCTRDLPISYSKKGIESIGFINKHGILREKSSSSTCNQEIQVYNVQGKQIAKVGHEVVDLGNGPTDSAEILDDSNEKIDFQNIFVSSSSRLETLIWIFLLLFVLFVKKTINYCNNPDLPQSEQQPSTIQLPSTTQLPSTIQQPSKNQEAANQLRSQSLNGLNILLDAIEEKAKREITSALDLQCKKCNRVCLNKPGLVRHEASCKN